MKKVTLDFETRSMCDLKRRGAYNYSLDPSTRPTCLAFKIVGDPKVYFLDYHVVDRPWRMQSEKLKNLWIQMILEGYLFTAHNAMFEKSIYENIMVKRYGWPRIPFRQFRCTAAKAAACALPRNLEGVGEVLKLRVQKDRRGYQAMMATCKPTRAWNEWQRMKTAIEERLQQGRTLTKKQQKWHDTRPTEPPVFLEPDAAPEVFDTLYRYCKIDVRSEELVDLALPDLIPSEQEIWFQNQMLNWRGLRIDIPTVRKIVDILQHESTARLKELDTLTMGLVTKPGARKSILEFLALEGIELPDLRKNTVDDRLEGFDLSDDMRRLLEIRKALSKTSTRKYQTMIDRASLDDRVRDVLLYHGASTGRDSGVGVQFHNLPRPLIKQKEIEWIIEMIEEL